VFFCIAEAVGPEIRDLAFIEYGDASADHLGIFHRLRYVGVDLSRSDFHAVETCDLARLRVRGDGEKQNSCKRPSSGKYSHVSSEKIEFSGIGRQMASSSTADVMASRGNVVPPIFTGFAAARIDAATAQARSAVAPIRAQETHEP
jgi:hypothetical protein